MRGDSIFYPGDEESLCPGIALIKNQDDVMGCWRLCVPLIGTCHE